MKLNEIVQPASQFMTDHDQIKAWLNTHHVQHYTIHPSGVVDVNSYVNMRPREITLIPIQFGRIEDDFICTTNRLISLAGCPYWVGIDFYCHNNKITSLSGIHKLIKHIGGEFSCDERVTNVLGLMLIDGLQLVNIDNNGPVNKIMNKHLQGDRDIHRCQEDLIEAGYGAQAKL